MKKWRDDGEDWYARQQWTKARQDARNAREQEWQRTREARELESQERDRKYNQQERERARRRLEQEGAPTGNNP